MMKAFICVYRHPLISPKDWQIVQGKALHNPDLRAFLEAYAQPGSMYDWGDDPSFFQTLRRLGDPRKASWGVCRPNVRRQLQPTDVIVYVCASASGEPVRGAWNYYYIGYATVERSIRREDVFEQDQYADYRPFFNMISRWNGVEKYQYEEFERDHDHYGTICDAGYILFQREATHFDLDSPLAIARFEPGDTSERWFTGDPLVVRLKSALWLDGKTVKRQLNSGNWRRPHVHIPIHRHLKKAGRLQELGNLVPALARLRSVSP